MRFLDNILKEGKRLVAKYAPDRIFLEAACAAAALVTAADGKVEDDEVKAALDGLQSNPLLKEAFSATALGHAFEAALGQTGSRVGKITLTRAISALIERDEQEREDVFLIAADVADNSDGEASDIRPVERAVLDQIAAELGVNSKRLLG